MMPTTAKQSGAEGLGDHQRAAVTSQSTEADSWNISSVVFPFDSLQLAKNLGREVHCILAVLTIITALQTTQAQLA